jgi:hypothetical protein
MTSKPKTPNDKADFDPAAVLRQIAANPAAPAGARVAAARTLMIHGKAGKTTPEAETKASPLDRAALRIVAGKHRRE